MPPYAYDDWLAARGLTRELGPYELWRRGCTYEHFERDPGLPALRLERERADAIGLLRDLAARRGHTPSFHDAETVGLTWGRIQPLFGGYRAMVEAAGLPPARRGRQARVTSAVVVDSPVVPPPRSAPTVAPGRPRIRDVARAARRVA